MAAGSSSPPMARAGAARWRGRGAPSATEGDEVQRSLELLDRVLSEFDDLENGNSAVPGGGGGGNGALADAAPSSTGSPGGGDTTPSAAEDPSKDGDGGGGVEGGGVPEMEPAGHASSSTPDDESPSLGHQSEDDGYMSMNGRRAKFVLSFRPVPDEGGGDPGGPEEEEEPPPPSPSEGGGGGDPLPTADVADFPPPPEEAERIISTLLPRVSPANSAKRSSTPTQIQLVQDQRDAAAAARRGKAFLSALASLRADAAQPRRCVSSAATQTTLPKTRHQRPFGWERGPGVGVAPPPPPRELRFGSLPAPGAYPPPTAAPHARLPPPWLPPRTVPGVLERHRGVRRHITSQEENSDAPALPCVDYKDDADVEDEEDEERANFSEDSLEELPQPATKRSSIAWEVSLDDDPLLTPGSTKVIGRRRRRSGDHSSTGSIHRLRESDDWPEPPVSTEDEAPSPFSDSYYDSSATNDLDDFIPPKLPPQHAPDGTYIIRKGRKKERKPVPDMLSPPEIVQPKFGDLKRCSSTFDNIKSLIKDGLLEGLDDPPPDFKAPSPPGLIRVVSLPTLPSNDHSALNLSHHDNSHYRSKVESHRLQRPHELAVTMEEEEDLQFCSNLDNLSDELCLSADLSSNDEESKLIKQLEREHFQNLQNKANENKPKENGTLSSFDSPISNRNSLEKSHSLEIKNCKDSSNKHRQRSHHKDKMVNGQVSREHSSHSFLHNCAAEVEATDPWIMAAELNHVMAVPVVEESIRQTSPADNFKVTVEVLQHEFPPLPPSPVEEDEDEYSEIVHPSPVQTPQSKSDTLPEPFYRSPEPGSDPIGTRFLGRPCPPEPPPHQEPITSSLKTRSMDAGFSRGHRSHSSNSRREIPSERRTLPPELPGPPRRRAFHKRSAQSPREEGLQTSCSLPETPIFARGCDIPRTPHRRAPDVPTSARTAPRPSGLGTGLRRPAAGHGTTQGLGSGGLNQALVGAELLRLAGGPGRGWYPRHRQQTRPASVERLDRLAPGHSPGHSLPSPWDARDSRKPLTLPPNLSPKFFHRSPREALRRVTSLLIRKGSSSKESKRDALSPTGNGSGLGESSGESGRQKRGFFKSLWKRSRHYSLEQPPPPPQP